MIKLFLDLLMNFSIMYRLSNKLFRFFFNLFFLSIFLFFNVSSAFANDSQSDRLLQKISKDYTKKFCNGIGFGLSKNSAMDFAVKENNLAYSKKKGFENLDKQILASNIANAVIEKCGYPINMKGSDGIKQFEDDYLSMLTED